MFEGVYEVIFQNDGIIFKVAKYMILTGTFLLIIGFGLYVLLGIFSMFTDEKDEGDKSSFEDIQFNVGIEWKIMGYGLALIAIPVALFVIVGVIAVILLIIYSIFTSAVVLSWLFYPFIWLYNVLTDIPIIYYFLTAIVILLIAILFKLRGRRE